MLSTSNEGVIRLFAYLISNSYTNQYTIVVMMMPIIIIVIINNNKSIIKTILHGKHRHRPTNSPGPPSECATS